MPVIRLALSLSTMRLIHRHYINDNNIALLSKTAATKKNNQQDNKQQHNNLRVAKLSIRMCTMLGIFLYLTCIIKGAHSFRIFDPRTKSKKYDGNIEYFIPYNKVYVCVYVYICIYVYMYVYMYIYIYVYMYVYVHMKLCIYINSYIQ